MSKKSALHLNEAPRGPSQAIVDAAMTACMEGNRYPADAAIAALCAALGDKLKVEPTWVTIANGSLMLLHQIMIASGQQEMVYGWPSFADFPVLAKGLRMQLRPVDLCDDGSCDLTKIVENITDKTSLAVICTPNPPTGGIVTHTAAKQFLKKVPQSVTVLIDEAYGEFVRDPKAVRSLELVREFPNVVVTRSFSKAYGLAGFRVGYAIAQPELSMKISAAGLPRFQISSAAQAAAMAALNNPKEMQARIDAVVSERRRMTDMLQGLNVPVVEGHGNFIWLPVGELAQQVKERLGRHNILVHASMPFGVRISVGTSDDTDYLQEVWQKTDPLHNY